MQMPEDTHSENRRLRRTMRDLVALSTLPAVWTGLAPDAIARSLADVLLNTLPLDLVYVRLTDRTGQGGDEVVRTKHQPAANVEAVRAAIAPLLSYDRADSPLTIPDPSGGGTLHVAVTRFGIGGDHGVLVTGSSNPDYPTEQDRLLLGVGANQTAIVIQRRRADVSLRKSEQQFRTLFESMDEGYCVIEFLDGPHGPLSDYIHVLANPAYTTNAGIPDIVGRKVREMVPDEADAWVETYRNVLITGQPVRFERELVATGRHLDLAAFRIEPPEYRQVAVLFKDVTARKQAEKQLQDADRRKDEFLAMLAHELRNPLAPIGNALQIMKLSEEPEEQDRARALIERQIGQMVRLVDDLLDVSRISSGKIELKKEFVELASVVDQAVEAARPLAESMGHRLTVTVPQEPIHLIADPARLAQVIGNLLNNACKYSERGGEVSLTVARTGAHVALRVRDTGIGLARDELSRIFERFTQVDVALEKSQGGLGIGLNLVKSLVELHEGTVEAHSDGSGRGSEFVVWLPVAVAPTQIAGSGPASIEEPAGVCRILVVDDNHDAALSLATLLRLRGHEVHTAHDGLEAVAAAGKFEPQVVLLDIGLPKLNGYEAARRIRKLQSDVLMVALTGWGQDEDRRRSREAGFDAHLVKPVDFTALTELLAKSAGTYPTLHPPKETASAITKRK